MKVGIIQSSYIPWRGYFDFIDDVDLFVFLDDVQYTRRDWRNRNKIKTPQGLLWLSVPVAFSRNVSQINIEDVEIDYSQKWVKKHINSIKHCYSKAKYYRRFASNFFEQISKEYTTISSLNVAVCKWVLEQLNINTKTRLSSEIYSVGSKTNKLIDILSSVKADTYLSGPSAKKYLDLSQFESAGIKLEFKTYRYLDYPQLHGRFEPFVSILDLLFNCGAESRSYWKSQIPNERIEYR